MTEYTTGPPPSSPHGATSERLPEPRSGGKLLWEEWVVGTVLCLLVLMVTAQVVSRYVLGSSLSYTEELVRYGFVWITFLGVAAAVQRRRHLSVAGAFTFLPARMRRLIRRAEGAAALVLGGILLWYGKQVVVLQFRTGQTTAALGFPMWVVGCALPAGSLLLIVRLLTTARRKDER